MMRYLFLYLIGLICRLSPYNGYIFRLNDRRLPIHSYLTKQPYETYSIYSNRLDNSVVFMAPEITEKSLPPHIIGKFKIYSAENSTNLDIGNENKLSELSGLTNQNDLFSNIYLLNIREGWGDGRHPTTRLCLEYIDEYMSKYGSDIRLLDYGTGSGILSIYAAKRNATKCLGVEVDEGSMMTAIDNAALNGVSDKIEVIHTARIYIGNNELGLYDLTVANILAGALTRLVGPIWGLTKPGGMICLSGMRLSQLKDVKRFYEPYVDMSTETIKTGTHEIFGQWARWTARTKVFSDSERKKAFAQLSDMASG